MMTSMRVMTRMGDLSRGALRLSVAFNIRLSRVWHKLQQCKRWTRPEIKRKLRRAVLKAPRNASSPVSLGA